jgi:hypothetical protein
LYFSELVNSLPVKYRHLGNAPEFNISIEVETLEHTSSLEGLASVDKEVILSQKLTLAVTLDELNDENLALLFSGEKATHTNVSVAGFTIRTLIANANLAVNTWYDIVNSAGERAYDVRTADLALATSAGSPVSLVAGTDYTLDEVNGRVFIKDTAVITTAIAGGGSNGNITAVLTANAGANAVNEVRGLTKTNVRGALKFIGKNPANNDKQVEYQFHQVSLKAEGDFSLIGNEFSTMSFTGVAEKNITADSLSPTLTIRTVAD